MTSTLNRTTRQGAEPAALGARTRVVISMKKVKPLTREQHQQLKADARSPQKTRGRVFPTF